MYFDQAVVINSAFQDSMLTWAKLIFHFSYESNPELYKYIAQLPFYNDPSSYSVSVIAALFGTTNGTTYIPIAFLFSTLCFTGIWAMYVTFVKVFPRHYKQLAIGFLFVPTMLIWSSAIFKDTLCIAGLGWMIYATFRLFVDKDFSFKNILLLIVGFYLVATIKIYILLAFLPALALWLLMTFSRRIPNVALRYFLNLVFVGLVIGGFYIVSGQFEEQLNRYSLSSLAETSASTRNWINYSSGFGGSAYDLGDIEPTLWGMISKFPEAVTVTLFRPFPWESTKLIIILTSVESILFFFGTIFLLVKKGVIATFRKIFASPTLTFFLLFSLIFAFAVGISSYNFGALSRYKIPCLPFYASLVLVCLYEKKPAVSSVTSHSNKLKKVSSLA